MADKPSINLSLAALQAEIGKPEPFVLALSNSKRITFPDIFDLPASEAEEFFEDMRSNGQNDFDFLKKWLSEEDYEAYKAQKVPLRVHSALIERVMDYYQSTLGTKGEGTASAS